MNLALRILLSGATGLVGAGGGGSGVPSTDLLWSVVFAAATTGDDLVISADDRILMDVAQTPVYGSITNNGLIVADRSKDTELRFDAMTNDGGEHWIGDLDSPFPRNMFTCAVTPSGAHADDPQLGAPAGPAIMSANRGVLVKNGGSVAWVADVPDVTIFKLGDTAEAGDAFIVADQPVTFKAGDRIRVGTSMYWQEGLSDNDVASLYPNPHPRRPGYGGEVVTVASDVTNGTTIPINHTSYYDTNGALQSGTTLAFRHHGKIQYLVAPAHEDAPGTNLSYTQHTILDGDIFGYFDPEETRPILGSRVKAAIAAGAPDRVDNRSTCGLLTHPIKFGAPLDTDWTTHGYGAHLMVMGLSSKKMLQGVERYRVGQAGFLGRYPDHDHMRSYTPFVGATGSGVHLGDVDPDFNFTQYCSTHGSSNRGNTIHGTCGSVVKGNVYSETDTHCIFEEDGSERRNVIDGNFISAVNYIGYGKAAIKAHDVYDFYTFNGGPAGIWHTSPDNYLRNNIIDGANFGIWNSYAFPYYSGYTTAHTGTGNGTVDHGATVISLNNETGNPGDVFVYTPDEVVTFTAVNATTFHRVGSVSGSMSDVTVGVQAQHGSPTSYKYTIVAGTTPFVAGDTFTCTMKRFSGCFGASRDVDFTPAYETNNLQHYNNEVACSVHVGMRSQGPVSNESGVVLGPDNHLGVGTRRTYTDESRIVFEKLNNWKGSSGWYVNEADHPSYLNWTCAAGRTVNSATGYDPIYIRGATGATSAGGNPGSFGKGLFASGTLDDYYREANTHQGAMMVSYGGGMFREDCIFIPHAADAISVSPGLPHVLQDGQVMFLWDFYVYPVNYGWKKDSNSVILGSPEACGLWGMRFPPLFLLPQFGSAYTDVTGSGIKSPWADGNPWSQGNSGAVQLPDDGSWYGRSGWYCHDSPFILYGTSGTKEYVKSVQGYPDINGVIVDDTNWFYGLTTDNYDGVDIRSVTFEPINYTRLQSDGVTAVTNGTWNTGVAQANYPNMRHAAVADHAVVVTHVPGVSPPSTARLGVDGMVKAGGDLVWAIDWSGAALTSAYITNYGSTLDLDYHNFVDAGSKANLLAATSCKYWIDSTNHRLWLKIIGHDLRNNITDAYPTDRKLRRRLDIYLNHG